MSAHTKGPWVANGDQVEVQAEHNDGYRICDVFGSDYKANARLIAAAPDLLEACRKMVHWRGYRGADNELRHRDGQQPDVAAAMDAIAKATSSLSLDPDREGRQTPSEHPDNLAVDRFAVAMKAKLDKKRADGRGGWENPDECSIAFLSQLLREHVDKGDPVDVGNLSMMIHQRGGSIE
jgi:hypothetical protein